MIFIRDDGTWGYVSRSEEGRFDVITPMNQDHATIECTPEDFNLDEAKINHDERMAIVEGVAWALGKY